MNNAEKREVQKARNTAATAPHYAATTLAILMRSATKKTLGELIAVVDELGLGDHLEIVNGCYVAKLPATSFIQRIPAPLVVPDLELEPKAPVTNVAGLDDFKGREPMVTQEQLQAMDQALTAKKATAGYRDLSDLYSLSQQNRGAL